MVFTWFQTNYFTCEVESTNLAPAVSQERVFPYRAIEDFVDVFCRFIFTEDFRIATERHHRPPQLVAPKEGRANDKNAKASFLNQLLRLLGSRHC